VCNGDRKLLLQALQQFQISTTITASNTYYRIYKKKTLNKPTTDHKKHHVCQASVHAASLCSR